ncbi:lipopolysaccharide biosynthesis protein [Soonwooa sp.]|uniref:lipopolysaccharide biosynthesis protein n=1 Tax=Soonwooa sp. TaxID=1938592 RepID=UPI0035AF8CDD
MSLRKQALSGMLWSSIQTFGNQFINFGVSIILARLLLPAEFGLIGMIGIFMGVGGALIGSGLGASLIRTTDADQGDYSTVFVFNFVGSIIIYAVMFIAAPYIADFFKQPVLTKITRLYTLSFIISAFTAVQVTRLHKHLDFKTETKSSLVSTLVSAVVGVSLAYSGFGVMSLVWMGLAGAVVNTAMLWVQSGWRPSLIFDQQKFRYHFGFGSRMMFSGILDILFSNAYTILIGKFYAPAQLGFYNRADIFKTAYTDRSMLHFADSFIKEHHIDKLSFVLNNVKTEFSRYGNKYGYGYYNMESKRTGIMGIILKRE